MVEPRCVHPVVLGQTASLLALLLRRALIGEDLVSIAFLKRL